MHEPKPYDAVLGNNQVPNAPYNAAVLGGIEVTSSRLNSTSLPIKLEALINCLNYEEEGVKIVRKFINQETDTVLKWIYSNWVWLKAPNYVRVKLINHISCLKHISNELMELVLETMVIDSSGSLRAPVQKMLEEINELHRQQTQPQNLAIGYQNLGNIYISRFYNVPYNHIISKIMTIISQKVMIYKQKAKNDLQT
jgi:hypothetical protein